MDHLIELTIWSSNIPTTMEVAVADLSFQDGVLLVENEPYLVKILGDDRNEVIGLVYDEKGFPQVQTRWFDQQFTWMWEDLMLIPMS